jgi:hypothetical protein
MTPFLGMLARVQPIQRISAESACLVIVATFDVLRLWPMLAAADDCHGD